MMPSDHAQVHAEEGTPGPISSTATTPSSRDSLQGVALMPPPKAEIAVAKRWGMAQVQGSVPSPGVGH